LRERDHYIFFLRLGEWWAIPPPSKKKSCTAKTVERIIVPGKQGTFNYQALVFDRYFYKVFAIVDFPINSRKSLLSTHVQISGVCKM